MIFTHRLVRRSWLSDEIARDGTITTVLHVVPTNAAPAGSRVEAELADAIIEFMQTRNDIDRAVMEPA